mgnify:CR=1 FL=1
MNKIEFDDYLVRGWECGANIFYNGKIYFSQCEYDMEKSAFNFYVFCFKAEKYGEHSFSPYLNKDGRYLDYKMLINKTFSSRDEAKMYFLSQKIFDGKSFWEIGDKFEWLDDDGPEIKLDK